MFHGTLTKLHLLIKMTLKYADITLQGMLISVCNLYVLAMFQM